MTTPPITTLQEAEIFILRTAEQGPKGVFTARLGPVGPTLVQMAFENALFKDHLRLLEVDARHTRGPNNPPELVRLYIITALGRSRLAQLRSGGEKHVD